MKTYDHHPLASTQIEMKPADFAALVESIKTDGLLEPIVLFQGKVLDGRHRQSACIEAGVEATYKKFAGDFGAARRFVENRNQRRVHGTPAQLAAAAKRLAAEQPDLTPAEIAKKTGVSARTARAVKKKVGDSSTDQTREKIAAYLKANPDASMKAAARVLKVSDNTVRKVRDAMKENKPVKTAPKPKAPKAAPPKAETPATPTKATLSSDVTSNFYDQIEKQAREAKVADLQPQAREALKDRDKWVKSLEGDIDKGEFDDAVVEDLRTVIACLKRLDRAALGMTPDTKGHTFGRVLRAHSEYLAFFINL